MSTITCHVTGYLELVTHDGAVVGLAALPAVAEGAVAVVLVEVVVVVDLVVD